ncbi:MAG: transporter, family, multidrug resistance protein [Gaiellales bacterium]|nr:transporter, family, multidrug resistance protein [Gaiellales bacterium]
MRQFFRSQPTAVWAVAFAAVVSFMGLGLVDPILPAIAHDLHASPSDVELLFTSYFAFTGLSMLFSSVVASRIGAKRTLLAGLVLIIVFSALAGLSSSVGEIVGLRAGWGFGNALFIATALSLIVGSASGGVGSAVMIYEAALGLGISFGPLVGGELGGISWRGPFFGVAALMAIGFIAIVRFLPTTPAPPRDARISVLEPLRALRHRATRGSGLIAIFYNFGFFTLLGYAPFPLHLSIHQLGYTFTGWGLLLALFAVFVAPRISRRFSDVRGLAGALIGIVAVLLVMAVAHTSQTTLIVSVICSGAFFGITNTLMTQVVMESAPVERAIASSAYSFVRFCGGAIAPYVAGKLGEHVSVQAPFYLGAGMTAIAVGLLWFYRTALVPVGEAPPRPAEHAQAIETPVAANGHGPLVIAVGGPRAREVCAMTLRLARARAGPVHVIHVVERDIVAGEEAIDLESTGAASDLLDACVAELREAEVPVVGELLQSVGTHLDVAVRILDRAAQLEATTIVLGPETQHGPLAARVVAEIAAMAPCHVLVLHPEAGPLGRPDGDRDPASGAPLWRTSAAT